MINTELRRTLTTDFDKVVEALPAALMEQGFGVLTEIDIKATFKKKLDLDYRRYKILGACSPKLAHEALEHQLEIGLMLPCNVVVYETDDGDTTVAIMDPAAIAQEAPALQEVAVAAREKLARVLEGLA